MAVCDTNSKNYTFDRETRFGQKNHLLSTQRAGARITVKKGPAKIPSESIFSCPT